MSVTPWAYPRSMTELLVPAPLAAVPVRRAHGDAVAYVGAAVRHREEREVELAAALAPGSSK